MTLSSITRGRGRWGGELEGGFRVAGNCTCPWVPEPGYQRGYDPVCPVHGEKCSSLFLGKGPRCQLFVGHRMRLHFAAVEFPDVAEPVYYSWPDRKCDVSAGGTPSVVTDAAVDDMWPDPDTDD